MAPSWLIYAFGGGFGHLTRACALARAAPPETLVRILTISPYTGMVEAAMPDVGVAAFDGAMSAEQGRAEVFREIRASSADCLIVDTFPRGVVGELVDALPEFPGLKVFVQRDLNPHYIAKYDLNTFVANSYDLILVPGDTTPDSLGPFAQTVITAPWLMRSAGDLLPRDRARELLGLTDKPKCILVCAAGNAGELNWYGAAVSQLVKRAPECDIRCVSPVRPYACRPECWISYWPAMDLYSAVDVVIGGAGYNTVYECVACGVPLVAKAWPRKYDRQQLRALRAARIADEPDQAVDAAIDLLRSSPPHKDHLHFENGATEAIKRIRQQAGDI